jgi:hypothetical protein
MRDVMFKKLQGLVEVEPTQSLERERRESSEIGFRPNSLLKFLARIWLAVLGANFTYSDLALKPPAHLQSCL